jgi:thiamine biosynthesis lipoprotein
MGTTYTVKVVAAPAGHTRDSLRAEVEAILGRIDRQFSTYRDDSEISRFNLADSTEWLPVSADVVAVARTARRMSQWSGGAFDITAAPLLSLWGFGRKPGNERVPGAAEIAAAQRNVGYRKLQIRASPPALRKQVHEVQLDLNALVAGHAADLVAARFEQLGVRNYLVDMGGEFRLKGHNALGHAWAVAVEAPFPDRQRTGRILELTDCAVSTSGSYRNFFELDGQRYTHVLDARNGRPIRHDLASVTVLAPTALEADAWATALLILGHEEGMRLAEHERLAALFMVRRGEDFEETASSAFGAYPVPPTQRARMVSPPPESRSRSGTGRESR